MITYLLKSASCLALLLVFYHLVLEREKMHNFNRFYLLGSVVFSFLAPLFIIYITVPAEETFTTVPIVTEQFLTTNSEEYIEPINYTQYLLLLSLIISAILSIRFIKNLTSIALKIKQNEKITHQKATLVLVDDKITPHTFWNYIFINKDEYNSKKIEQELFTHELTHATQKHTLDVLLIEALKIVFWFNPTFYFLKKSIQLNHEFLADTNVINNHKNISEYQYLLLNKTAWKNEYYLASNLNYLLTKKRLQMMTKQSSQTKILIKKLAVIPLLVGFVFLFAERVEAQEEIIEIVEETPEVQKAKSSDNTNTILVTEEPIDNNTQELNLDLLREFTFRDIVSKIAKDKNGDAFYKNYYDLTEEEKSKLIPSKFLSEEKIKKFQNFKTLKEQNKLPEIKRKDIIESYNGFASKIVKSKNFREGDYLSLNEIYKELSPKQRKRVKSPNSIYPKNILSKFESNRKKRLESGHIYTVLKQDNNVGINDYQSLNSKYNKLRNQKPHYVKSSKKRQRELDNLFSKLGSMYFKLSKADKRRVERPTHPFKPYLKLKKNNKVFYKLEREMTEEDKLLIPPPPPRPNASKEEKDRAKRAYQDWKKRTGNDGAPPPPPKNLVQAYNKTVNKILNKPRFVKVKDINYLKKLYNEMSTSQRKQVILVDDVLSKLPPPLKMDKIFTYQKLANKIQKTPKISKDNLNYLKKLYNDLSNEERKLVKSPKEILPPKPVKIEVKDKPKVKEIKTNNEIVINDKFKIILERKANNIKLTCLSGCTWKKLEFSTEKIKYINKYGVTNSVNSTDKDFLFSLNMSDKKIHLNGIEGTAWKKLSFNTLNNEKILINKLGLSRLNLANNIKYYLDNKEIAKQDLNKRIRPNQIKSVDVKKEKNGNGSIFITSK